MAQWRPDPTFYPSPKLAMQAPAETRAFVALLNPAHTGRPDALAVVDIAPASGTYSQIVGQVAMPNAGDERHHFGWNACSSCLCPYSPHPHMKRRYLLLGAFHGLNPGMGWLFAVALGLQEKRRQAVFNAVLPIACGHAAAIGAVALGTRSWCAAVLVVATRRLGILWRLAAGVQPRHSLCTSSASPQLPVRHSHPLQGTLVWPHRQHRLPAAWPAWAGGPSGRMIRTLSKPRIV